MNGAPVAMASLVVAVVIYSGRAIVMVHCHSPSASALAVPRCNLSALPIGALMTRTSLPPLPMFAPPGQGRSRNMAAIKSTNTRPEMYVRQALHAAGFRFRLHRKDIPGRPDVVLPRYSTAVQVQGCYWHGHGCRKDHKPHSNRAYWAAKIARNMERDKRNLEALREAGWQLVIIWECTLVGQTAKLIDTLEIQRDNAEHGAQ